MNAVELLQQDRSRLATEIADLEKASSSLAEKRQELSRIDRALSALGAATEKPKPRARRGAALEIIEKIVGDNEPLSDDVVIDLAKQWPDAPSVGALRRALRDVRKRVGAKAEETEPAAEEVIQ